MIILKRQPGIIALTTVLIIGAVVLVASLGIAFRSVSETKITVTHENSYRAFSLATACMEKALLSLADNASYGGNETINIDGDSCIINTLETLGTSRIIKTHATYLGYIRRIQVTVSQTTPPLQVSSWQEVSSF